MTTDEKITYLTQSGLYPKEDIRSVTVPKGQESAAEWNALVGVAKDHQTELARIAPIVAEVDGKVPYVTYKGKNRFNMNADTVTIYENVFEEESGGGYIWFDDNGGMHTFISGTNANKHLKDDLPDKNIECCSINPYFGFIYYEPNTTSHKIQIEEDYYTLTFYNGGVVKYVTFYKDNGEFVGFTQTGSDKAHLSFCRWDFSDAAYFRVSVATDKLGNLQIEKGSTATEYEPFSDETSIPRESLPSNVLTTEKFEERYPTAEYVEKTASYMIQTRAGSWVDGKPVVGSGSLYLSDYVEIAGGLVYCFLFVNDCRFYDVNHNLLDGTALKSGFAYQAPANARYMAIQFNGVDRVRCVALAPSDYVEADRETRLSNITTEDSRRVAATTNNNYSTYVIGDSEASRFFSLVKSVHFNKIVSSFGGHRTDFIWSNVGIGSGGIGNINNVKGCNVIVVSGTNDMFSGSTSRMIAYHRELINELHKKGAVDIYAISPFLGLDHTKTEFFNGDFLAAMKRLYGGKFIDICGHISDSGLYFNPYHPNAFTQPSVGGSCSITFEDLSALTECGMIAANKTFYIRYYDDKVDKYVCTSYSGNTVTATLSENGSDVAPGGTAGQYEEEEATAAWTGTKKTLGFVYADNDVWTLEQDKMPWHIYPDHSVHFGKILARVIDQVLQIYFGLTDE